MQRPKTCYDLYRRNHIPNAKLKNKNNRNNRDVKARRLARNTNISVNGYEQEKRNGSNTLIMTKELFVKVRWYKLPIELRSVEKTGEPTIY